MIMFKELSDVLHTQCRGRNIPFEIEMAMLSQAQIESGTYIDSKLSTDAFNFWGMKTGSKWKGRVYTVSTREVINGRDVYVEADFRMYDDITTGVWGYFDFLSMPIYENALESKTAKEFMDRVCRHWATDLSYRAKWKKLFNRLSVPVGDITTSVNYTVGKNYTIMATGLAVRINADIKSPLVGYDNLTADGKIHDRNRNGYLDKGTIVTVKKIVKLGDETWLLVPSGWICATMNGEVYVE